MEIIVGLFALIVLLVAINVICTKIQAKFGNGWANAFAGAVFVVVIGSIFFPSACGCGNSEKAREVSCASNMKQLGLGLLQYEQDYDQKLSGGADRWAGQIYSYEKSTGVYKCPDDNHKESGRRYPVSYAMNANVRGSSTSDLADASSSVLATEIDCPELTDMTHPERTSQYTTGTSPNTAWGGIRMGTTYHYANMPRHDPAVMFLACDGHVKLLRPEKVSSGVDNPSLSGMQDAVHAAGTAGVGRTSRWTLTFSEK